MAKMRLKPLSPGELTRRVTFQQLADVTSPTGHPGETWTTLAILACRKLDMRGDEGLAAATLSSPFDTIWETWYRKDIDPDLVDVTKTRRIVYVKRIYDIIRAMPIEISGIRQGLQFETLAAGRFDG